MRFCIILVIVLLTNVALINAQGIPNHWEFINNHTQLQMGKERAEKPL